MNGVCMRERERERESECVKEKMRERKSWQELARASMIEERIRFLHLIRSYKLK